MRELKRIAIAATVLLQTAVIAQTKSVSSNIYTEKNGIGSAGIEKPVLSPKEQLEENIEKMKKDPLLRNATWGFVVYDTKKKEVITGYNEDKPLIPASTTKLLSTDASMALLGGRFKWITQ